ncbi:hypothetical protein OESDEN_02292 [Oesophagostomum dentatum]|uniref:Uncharacterized protein n=1 Tax=Oesophagostomum dentatum TaxID=61180 RepID=A0A0B1TKH0_OESDE|nr:hypothetical protein OESDEN_02292 [Oesophagostomum dentatum]
MPHTSVASDGTVDIADSDNIPLSIDSTIALALSQEPSFNKESVCFAALNQRYASMGYREGVLSGRKIYWCPDGEGNLPFCPSPSDPDEYVYCCQFFTFNGDTYPSCCRFPMYTGILYALIISAVLLFLLLLFLYCWFWPASLLNVRRRQKELNRHAGFSRVNGSSLSPSG